MTEKPFVHNKAGNVKTSFIYHDDVANLFKLLNQRNQLSGEAKFIYDFKKEKKILKKF